MKHVFSRLISVMLVLAVLMGAVCSADEATEQKLEALYTLASSYIQVEDYEKAEPYLTRCLDYCSAESYPAICADVHLKLGCVYTIQKDYEKALTELDAALAVDGTLYSAYMVKAQVYTENEDYENAIAALEYYIEKSGDDTMKISLAELYKLSGDEEKGDVVIAEYQEQLDTAKAFYDDGTAKMEQGDYAAAAESFIACAEDSVYGPNAQYCAGVCLVNAADYKNALFYLESALLNGIDIDGIYYNCGLCRMMLEDFSNAVVYFTASIMYENYAADAYYNRAVCYLNLGSNADSAADFTYYIDSAVADGTSADDPDYPKALYFRAMSNMLLGQYEDAAADYTALIDTDFQTSDCMTNRALCYVQTGKYEEAIADADACIEAEANVAECTYYRAVSNANLGRIDEALADFGTCIELGYDVANMYYQRAQIYQAIGDTEHYLSDLENYVNS